MKSTFTVAAIAALCSYGSAKEIEMDAENDASLYRSGIMHEKIMHTKEVRELVPAHQCQGFILLTFEITDLLG